MSDRQFQPTPEQEKIRDAFAGGGNLVIEAGAGSGKTSTLRLIGESTRRRGLYVAYNRAIADDARGSFSGNVAPSTAHSLAYRAVGRQYAHRLKGPRVPARDVARILAISGPSRIGDAMLAPEQVARLVTETVARYARSADSEPAGWHVPRKPGLDSDAQLAELRHLLTPLAVKAWREIISPDGRLRFEHDHYLKLWALSRPQLAAEFILLDECQPTGTQIMTAPGVYLPIESLKAGDRVVSYDRTGPRLRLGGSQITDVRVRRYEGELVSAWTDAGLASRYTPDHKCLALIGEALADKWALYLMRRGERFRIGMTRGFYGSRDGKTYRGVRSRAWEENADAIWVLDVFDTKIEAQAAEALNSWRFRIPQVRFNDTRAGRPNSWADDFWAKVGDLTSEAQECLAAFGRKIEYPFWSGQRGSYAVTKRPSIVRACNLMDGMELIAADGMTLRSGNFVKVEDRTPIKVAREPYFGDIWSLEVDGDHTYVADGLITHNCQDANPVILDVVTAQQHAQLIAVGDRAQAIYGWRGAVDAMDQFPHATLLQLSRSFRFGPAIADEANKWLTLIGGNLQLTGSRGVPSVLQDLASPDTVLCRTNAGVISQAMAGIADRKRVAVVGGGGEILSLAEAAIQLKAGAGTTHPELMAFRTWGEVQDHAENDAAGSDLKVLVRLIDQHGPEAIIDMTYRLVDERHADLIVSTAHKAKGREWPSVRIATDFREPAETDDGTEPQVSAPEAMLAYVAVTRARLALDRGGLAWVDKFVTREEDDGCFAPTTGPAGTTAVSAAPTAAR